jgi:hypothetical protein
MKMTNQSIFNNDNSVKKSTDSYAKLLIYIFSLICVKLSNWLIWKGVIKMELMIEMDFLTNSYAKIKIQTKIYSFLYMPY